MSLTWRDVFDTTKGSFYLYRDIWDAFKTAESVGYKYMCWNGLIYSVETHERTELTVEDLSFKSWLI